jgi:integrase
MACIRKRRGKYVVDYRDGSGQRRWITCDTRREADAELGKVNRQPRRRNRPAVDSRITVAEYAVRWLAWVEANVTAGSLKPRTLESYDDTLRLHIVPAIGKWKIVDLDQSSILDFLSAKLAAGLSRNSVRIIHATLRRMLRRAVLDCGLFANPAEKLGQDLKLVSSKGARQDSVKTKALTREQLDALLGACWTKDRRSFPVVLTMARTGLRIGEALALKWDDVDIHGRRLRVARTLSDDGTRIDTPKSGHGRDVDLSTELTAVLRKLHVLRKEEALRHGRPVTEWVFSTPTGTHLDPRNVRRAFGKALKEAKLPPHFTPHSLRHSYASILIAEGVSPAYVQRQLGHASITLTVDTYGSWLPCTDKTAVDSLDSARVVANGSKVVAAGEGELAENAQLLEKPSGPGRDRTANPLIKSQRTVRITSYQVSASGCR